MNNVNLAELVTKICKEKSLSEQDFANRMYITKETAHNLYFLGQNSGGKISNKRISTIIDIANALEIDPVIVFKACVKDRNELLKIKEIR